MTRDRLSLDEVDVLLIRALQENARQSLRAISKTSGISTPTLSSKLQRLVESGAIKSFTAVIDSSAFGLKDYLVEIHFKPSLQKNLQKYSGELHHYLFTQDSRMVGIFSGTDKEVMSLYTRLSSVKGVERISVTPTVAYEMNANRPSIESGARLSSNCYFCRGEINGPAVTEILSGKSKYFCCTSCRTLYLEKFARISANTGE